MKYMNNLFEASVIISFYNKIDWLLLVLAGFEIQSFKAFEILIADDGSEKKATDQLKQYIHKSPLNILHIWHEDKGWRKTTILNKAVVASRSDYLIFCDGDCIPHSKFVEEHLRNKQTGCALAGRRVNLSESMTKLLTPEKVRKSYLENKYLWKIIIDRIVKKEGSHIENAFYLKSNFIRKRINKKRKGILGSNFSLHKTDILAINGFDERYKAPAVGEDSDIRFRLEFNGVKIIPIKHLAIQYHLYHEKLHRESGNLLIFDETQKKNVIFTPFGIDKSDAGNQG